MNSMIQNQHKLSITEIVSFGVCLLFSFLSFGQNAAIRTFADQLVKEKFEIQNQNYLTDQNLETAALLTINPGKAAIINTPTHQTGTAQISWAAQPNLKGKVVVFRVKANSSDSNLSSLKIGYYNGNSHIKTLTTEEAIKTGDYYDFIIEAENTQITYVKIELKTATGGFGGITAVKNSVLIYGLYYREANKPAPNLCKYPEQRNYASKIDYESGIADVGKLTNKENAVDKNPHTRATLSIAAGFFGTNKHTDLKWDHMIEPGTPVSIKFGQIDMDATLVKRVEVAGIRDNQVVSDWVLIDDAFFSAFGAGYTDDTTFIPSTGNGRIAVPYNGIRVKLTIALAGFGVSTDIYGAYYYQDTPKNQQDCTNLNDVRDLIWGATGNAGNAVKNPQNAIDGNENTAASFSTVLDAGFTGVQHYIETSFETPFLKNDILEVIVSDDKGVKLDFWKNMKIQKKMGEENVGDPITKFSFLSLWGARSRIYVPTDDAYAPFDRVRITTSAVVTVASEFYIHEIRRTVDPTKIIDNAELTDEEGYILKKTIDCQGGIRLNNNANDGCTTYKWYDENGDYIGSGFSVDVPKKYSGGTHTFYLQPTRYACETLARIGVTFTVTNCGKDCINSNPTLTSFPNS